MKVYELCSILENIAPLARQEEWDNCGLLIGGARDEISKILVCLDIDEKVMDHACRNDYDLIISHHPLIFKEVRKLTGEDEVQKIIAAAIKKGISIYSMHTNYDHADRAMNDHIAEQLGLEDIRGCIHDRSGAFTIGRIGVIKEGIEIRKLAVLVKEKLGLDSVFYSGSDTDIVKTVLISAGAFDPDLFNDSFSNIDAIVSGDIKYHTARDLKEKGTLVIDAGHFGTESIFPKLIKQRLGEYVKDIVIETADFERDVFSIVL